MGKSSFGQLVLFRWREFSREPETLFWVFIFPILLTVALGLAFRNQGPQPVAVAVAGDTTDAAVRSTFQTLHADSALIVRLIPTESVDAAFRSGQATVVVVPGLRPTYRFDRRNPASASSIALIDRDLQRAAGRQESFVAQLDDRPARGSRYVDFLIPGLIGLSIMNGSIWGVGWNLVQMRSKKLLRRLAATPMSKAAFLGSFILMRLVFLGLELGVILLFGRLAFDVRIAGSILDLALVVVLGAASFSGIAGLIASRASKSETAQGLMNLVTFPMLLVSGVFFASTNFPDAMQPVIRALPLTALNTLLRAVVNSGTSPWTMPVELLVLVVWGVVPFALALRWFRWT